MQSKPNLVPGESSETPATSSNAALSEPGEGITLSVVIPAYNEEESIEACVREVAGVLEGVGGGHEILVVDDGSSDDTFQILRKLRQEIPCLRVIRFARNCGQTAAFDAGFKAAAGKVVATMDADLQNDPADIPKMLALMDRWDVVCGVRQKRRDSLLRRMSSRIANAVRNRMTGDSIRDVGCSLRAMRAECLAGLKLYDGMHRFLPTLLKWDGWRVTEAPVNHRPRRWGKSKYGVRNRLFRGLRDLMAVRWMRSRWLRYEIEEENP